MSYIKSIGENVRRHRLIKGLSQDDLGKRAKLSPGHISEIENGIRKSIQARTVKKLARGLEVSILDLLEEGEDDSDGSGSNCVGSQGECAASGSQECRDNKSTKRGNSEIPGSNNQGGGM